MERFDVIVVGAGPAGSTAARECAARGLATLLLDKDAFPRDKPCGGGVNVRAAALLPFDLAPVVERAISAIRFTVRQGAGFTRTSAQPLTYMTQRRRLDAYLVERAVASGATLRDGTPVRGVDRRPSHVLVRTDRGAYEGRSLVVADGANGPTARLAGLSTRHRMGVGLEGNVTPASAVPPDWQQTMGLDLGDVPEGYGWLFPKGDHVNIGVAGFGPVGTLLRGRLVRLTASYGYDPKRLWGLRGFRLPMRAGGTTLASGNVLAVGDAAGLLDPITGEGIYAAIWSGRAAAYHLAAYLSGDAGDLRGYEQEVRANLFPQLDVAERWHDVSQLSQATFARLIERSPRAWNLVCRILRGEDTYAGFSRRHRGVAGFVTVLSRLRRLRPGFATAD
jgi:geranylgeranyl reductase family protein